MAQNFDCPDFAYQLSSCSYNNTVDSECFFGPHVAGVRCTESKSDSTIFLLVDYIADICSGILNWSLLNSCYTACFDGEIRLFNSNYTYDNGLQTVQGHVLVCFNGSFLPVCDLGWDNSDAQVVCNQRYGSNYSKKGKIDIFIELLKSCFFILCLQLVKCFPPGFHLTLLVQWTMLPRMWCAMEQSSLSVSVPTALPPQLAIWEIVLLESHVGKVSMANDHRPFWYMQQNTKMILQRSRCMQ